LEMLFDRLQRRVQGSGPGWATLSRVACSILI